MEKKGVLSTLRFIFFTVVLIALVFCAVFFTISNTYKPAVKTYINGKFIGYFSNEQQFDEVYNDLVNEKQNIDPNVKIYLEGEPSFDTSYIRETLFAEQNIYTNLRAEMKTEYTIYNVAVENEKKMTFDTQDEANKYAEELKKEVSKLKTEITIEKVYEKADTTSIERADDILKDIVSRNKPITTPKVPATNNKINNNTVPAFASNDAASQGGIWPTTTRNITSTYGWRWGQMHTGNDIGAPFGSPIYAYKSGLVTFSGWNSQGFGYLVKIDHGNGMSTWYAHCSKLLVNAGTEVAQGQVIAQVGNTGFSFGNHLHFEVRINGVPTNSYPYIAGK